MAKIYINGKLYDADESENLLQVCLSAGFNIPYFCWHPLLGSLGACRQCAVTQYNNLQDVKGRLVMSCMTPAKDGSIISINDPESEVFRKSIIEILLTNHPHDCPVCEEGGHCHLQDMTVMTQHNRRSYRFKKRTHKNQYLGSFIKHEMNRCITCYRCVRFYNDYANGSDFGVYGSNNNIYFGRIEDGCLENEHSGNLIELCPTGVFTDKIHSKRYNRKWDMQYGPGICHNCSIGCNISIGERYGEVRRVENRYHEDINHYLICDLGRFGHSHLNLHDRPKNPAYLENQKTLNILNFEQAIDLGSLFFQKYKRVIGIGSIRASIENNFALQDLVGKDNFSNGMSEKEQDCVKLILDFLQNSNVYVPSLKEIESYDLILVIGEDVTHTAPRIALAIRQAVKNKAYKKSEFYGLPKWHSSPINHISEDNKNPLYIMHTHESKLDNIAEWCYFASIDEQVNFSCAIAHELDKRFPKIFNLSNVLKKQASLIANRITVSKKILVVSGSHSFSSSIIQAAINVASAIQCNDANNHVGLTFLTPSANTLGAGIIGGMSIESAIKAFKEKNADAICCMEYDLYRFISKKDVDCLFQNPEKIITIDHQYTDTYQKSGLTLPSTSFAESSGTIINFEGRAQRFFQVYDPIFYDNTNCLFDSWRWLQYIQSKINKTKIYWKNLDDITHAYIKKYPIFQNIIKNEPDSNFRFIDQKVARSPIRYSGRTVLRSNIDIHEPSQPKDINTMFSFSMEGYNQPNKSITHIPFAWFPGWNSPQAWNKFQTRIGKNLISGSSGTHLFKKNEKSKQFCFDSILTFISRSKQHWYVVPYYYLFGNEELTQYSSVIQENIPRSYALMNVLDGIKLGLQDNSTIKFSCLNHDYQLNIRLSKNLCEKQIGLPIGRKGFPIALVGKKITLLQECVT
ncbi:NADH-quinone oxidoreductase subunit NuoG [Buchnera aphidicola (Hyadaphis tataricae)]|uniref:NADH-quinone oxidoreductase n=1 Tax=Buchnera aphidicola (Hyadaphis tataricae) TaxID=1241859 RepID=A0A4D6YAR2_9GAMM|nr:NADH-quinone oxidoreductase subunit NuoG [Buchnera aphidicola]QCI21475.1 NADH-quinone oxidoreductase subunit NuoG [Buchnera aphidicola (Hyadaphis tataricae)]